MSMSTPTKTPSEADIIFNRANIALARSQRLVASWLPPATTNNEEKKTEDAGAAGAKEDDDDDDDKIFTAVPERLGLGAPIPAKPGFGADGIWTSNSSNNNNNNKLDDKLRQRLLGRNAKKFLLQQQQQKQQQQQQQKQSQSQKPGLQNTSTHYKKDVDDVDDDDEEEEGRTSSLGKSKKAKFPASKKQKISNSNDHISSADAEPELDEHKNNTVIENDEDSDTKPVFVPVSAQPSRMKRKKAGTGSYLDELLQDRKKKKKKKAATDS